MCAESARCFDSCDLMMNPWLTLITVTKDDPDGLARTLTSAAALREHGAEHIVIDGGGVEPTHQTGATDALPHGVRCIRRPPQGVADAFNAGVAAASGTWVWFLNGGDQIESRLDAVFLSRLLSTTRADVIIGGIVYEGRDAPMVHPSPSRQWPSIASWIPHPASVMRRRLFERFGGFDVRYQIAMDYEWWLRVLGRDVIVDLIEVPFAIFAPGGMSQRPELLSRMKRERDDIIRRHQALLWRNETRQGLRLAKAWLRALFARRL